MIYKLSMRLVFLIAHLFYPKTVSESNENGKNVTPMFPVSILSTHNSNSGAIRIVRDGLLEIVRCQRVNVNGYQVLAGCPNAVYVEDSGDVSITGGILMDTRQEKKTRAMVRWKETGNMN